MYNRYVGNTGKFYRIEESPPEKKHSGHGKESNNRTEPESHNKKTVPLNEKSVLHTEQQKKQHSALNISSLLNGGITKSIDKMLPFGFETGDLVLLILFLFLYIESGDEEFLIILGFFAYSLYKEHKELR